MSKLSENIKQLLEDAGMSVTALANVTGIVQPVIYRMAAGETDNPKVQTLIPIARYFGITLDQLLGLEALPPKEYRGHHRNREQWHCIPVLSWENAVEWPKAKPKTPVEKFLEVKSSIGEQAFALCVRDSTMAPTFEEGSIIVADPELRPKNRDFVVAHLKGQGEATFKQILFDGSDIYLKPINNDFKTLFVGDPEELAILGVVREAHKIYS